MCAPGTARSVGRMTKRTILAATLAALSVWGATSVAAPFEHKRHETSHVKVDRQLRNQLAQMRVATAQYATDLEKAKADGYRIITPNMEDMGFHYLNPEIADFDVAEPIGSKPISAMSLLTSVTPTGSAGSTESSGVRQMLVVEA